MTNSIQEPIPGYQTKSKFNVILNGKPIAKALPYTAYMVAREHHGSVIKFASFKVEVAV